MSADAAEPAPRASTERTRDRLWACAVGAVALGVFLSTYSSHVSLADAPESVSGVRSLGILHAPGYPAYVAAARAFATIVPFGSWAARVNLFSVVCAVATVVILFPLARRFGASRGGSAIGALCVAVGVSYWFYAAYAKHYAFSGLVVAACALLVVTWEHEGGRWRLVVAGALLGAGMGSSWQLAAIMLVAVVVFLAMGVRRPRVVDLVIAAAALVFVGLAVSAFVIVRARQHPAVDWGEATNLGRFVNLVSVGDFRVGQAPATGFGALAHAPARLVAYLVVIAREMGLVAIAVAIFGAYAVVRRRHRSETAFLAVLLVLNLVTVLFAAGLNHQAGLQSGLVVGGFLLDAFFVVSILIASGVTELTRVVVDRIAASRGRAQQDVARRTFEPLVAGVIAAVLIVPSLVVHFSYADHRGPPLADRYGSQVLDALPARSVLLVWGAEFGMPVTYRQIVMHERPDVDVVSGPELLTPWYRDQVARELGVTLPPFDGDLGKFVTALVAQLRAERPVALDMTALQQLSTRVGYRPMGLVANVVDGTGPARSADLAGASNALAANDRDGGVGTTEHLAFPNHSVYFEHERAHIELAKAFAQQGNVTATTTELERALALEPHDNAVRVTLALIQQGDERAGDVLGSL